MVKGLSVEETKKAVAAIVNAYENAHQVFITQHLVGAERFAGKLAEGSSEFLLTKENGLAERLMSEKHDFRTLVTSPHTMKDLTEALPKTREILNEILESVNPHFLNEMAKLTRELEKENGLKHKPSYSETFHKKISEGIKSIDKIIYKERPELLTPQLVIDKVNVALETLSQVVSAYQISKNFGGDKMPHPLKSGKDADIDKIIEQNDANRNEFIYLTPEHGKDTVLLTAKIAASDMRDIVKQISPEFIKAGQALERQKADNGYFEKYKQNITDALDAVKAFSKGLANER